MRLVAASSAFVIVLAGCEVDRPDDLVTRFWECDGPADCADGYACADRSAFGRGFCRPVCDPAASVPTCDGTCTKSGECLEACEVYDDTCSDGHSCVRADLRGSEGVCYPVLRCARNDECGAGQACLSEVFDLPGALLGVPYSTDELYCLDLPDDGGLCPTGTLLRPASGVVRAACLPRCDGDGSRCAPSTTCVRDVAQIGASVCQLGTWGLPCDDDAQCAVGRCLDVGEGRRACTEECADAERLFGSDGCAAMERSAAAIGIVVTVACEPVGDRSLCVPRSP